MLTASSNFKRIVIVLLFTVLVAYGVFQARHIIYGPQIDIASPLNGSNATSSDITIQGNARYIVDITLNNRPIFVDENGNFQEEVLLEKGYNVVTLEAHDRFGRETRRELELTY